MEIKELVIKAKQNDEQAISELYNLTIRKVTFLARKYVKDEDAVNDVLQESYVKAFQSLNSLEDEEKFDKWLNTIVVRNCKNHLRKRHDIDFADLTDEDDYGPEDYIEDLNMDFSPKEATDYTELKNAMKDIIEELPIEQKMAVLMFYYQQYKTKEIAEILEVNENTIKARLKTAKKKIKDKVLALEEKGYKIRGIAPIPFLVWVLLQEEATTTLPAVSFEAISTAAGIGSQIGNQVAAETVKQVTKHTIKQGIKAKVIAGTVAATVVAGGAYYMYSNNVIDLMENIQYEILGTEEHGYIKVIDNDLEDIDTSQLISGYDIEGNGTLSNGDIVTITVLYDEDYAKDNGMKIKNDTMEIKIDNLTDVYQATENTTILEQIIEQSDNDTDTFLNIIKYNEKTLNAHQIISNYYGIAGNMYFKVYEWMEGDMYCHYDKHYQPKEKEAPIHSVAINFDYGNKRIHMEKALENPEVDSLENTNIEEKKGVYVVEEYDDYKYKMNYSKDKKEALFTIPDAENKYTFLVNKDGRIIESRYTGNGFDYQWFYSHFNEYPDFTSSDIVKLINSYKNKSYNDLKAEYDKDF